jgi:hypothetical protein
MPAAPLTTLLSRIAILDPRIVAISVSRLAEAVAADALDDVEEAN